MKYPTGTKIQKHNNITYANRGMDLEHDINVSNEYYRLKKRAVIHKKPTPVTAVKVEFTTGKDRMIKEGYYRTPSTTDYNGIYRGKYIDFEAKETKIKENFPLRNIHEHQIQHLKDIMYHGGIGFIIVRFTRRNETYYLDGEKLMNFIEHQSRKSIPIEYFQTEGYLLKDKFQPRVDYLEIIDKIYFGGNV